MVGSEWAVAFARLGLRLGHAFRLRVRVHHIVGGLMF